MNLDEQTYDPHALLGDSENQHKQTYLRRLIDFRDNIFYRPAEASNL